MLAASLTASLLSAASLRLAGDLQEHSEKMQTSLFSKKGETWGADRPEAKSQVKGLESSGLMCTLLPKERLHVLKAQPVTPTTACPPHPSSLVPFLLGWVLLWPKLV